MPENREKNRNGNRQSDGHEILKREYTRGMEVTLWRKKEGSAPTSIPAIVKRVYNAREPRVSGPPLEVVLVEYEPEGGDPAEISSMSLTWDPTHDAYPRTVHGKKRDIYFIFPREKESEEIQPVPELVLPPFKIGDHVDIRRIRENDSKTLYTFPSDKATVSMAQQRKGSPEWILVVNTIDTHTIPHALTNVTFTWKPDVPYLYLQTEFRNATYMMTPLSNVEPKKAKTSKKENDDV